MGRRSHSSRTRRLDEWGTQNCKGKAAVKTPLIPRGKELQRLHQRQRRTGRSACATKGEKLSFAGEGDGGGELAAGVVEAEARASLVGPGAVGSVAKIKGPLLAGEAALAALFMRESEIEVDVGVSGHGAGGATEMFDGGVEIALLFEDAAEIVARDAVQGIELDGVLE